jgi:hypothetical protein
MPVIGLNFLFINMLSLLKAKEAFLVNIAKSNSDPNID